VSVSVPAALSDGVSVTVSATVSDGVSVTVSATLADIVLMGLLTIDRDRLGIAVTGQNQVL
jgi:hypothetical protein